MDDFFITPGEGTNFEVWKADHKRSVSFVHTFSSIELAEAFRDYRLRLEAETRGVLIRQVASKPWRLCEVFSEADQSLALLLATSHPLSDATAQSKIVPEVMEIFETVEEFSPSENGRAKSTRQAYGAEPGTATSSDTERDDVDHYWLRVAAE